jgi:hypothetical protein
MAIKRSTGSESILASGAASAPARGRVTRKAKGFAAEEFTSDGVTNSQATDPTAPVPAALTDTTPTFEEIAHLAYSYWEARGYQGGSPEEDWLRAERHLRSVAATAVATNTN